MILPIARFARIASACIAVRVPVARFTPRRTLRRIQRLNADLHLAEIPPVATSKQFQLFLRYQASRHGDSEMARMSYGDYSAMIMEGGADTSLFTLCDGAGALLGVMLADRLADGFSAVYSFYDPDFERRSLGTQLILSIISLAQAENSTHVYLGYWIRESRKMAYKARFQPLEMMTAEGWATMPESR